MIYTDNMNDTKQMINTIIDTADPDAELVCADITWQTDNQGHTVPISTHYDDVYYSHGGGLAETTHVFLDGNHLSDRFLALPKTSPSCFIIGETGFGTGLNFLATCALWLRTAPALARLHFISTEKYPISLTDITKALAAWDGDPEMQRLAAKLLSIYPLPMAGCHRLYFSERITLDLWFGDATDSFTTLINTQTDHTLRVDAWFLDGFTPSKNNSLWTQDLFDKLHRLSHAKTTLATFSAAGFVRRGLIAAGFDMIKAKGYGFKREMIKTRADWLNDRTACDAACSSAPINLNNAKNIAVIGAGISGVMAATALIKRGHHVTLYDSSPPMSGASGNPAALFAPKLTIAVNAPNHLPTLGFLHAERFYRTLCEISALPLYQRTGVIDTFAVSQKSSDKHSALIAAYPDALIRPYDTADDDMLSAVDANALTMDIDETFAAYISMGGLLYPPMIWHALQSTYQLSFTQATVIEVNDGNMDQPATVTLILPDGTQKSCHHDIVVIAVGHMAKNLDDTLFDCRKIRGQVSWTWVDSDKTMPSIKYDGYSAVAPLFLGYHQDGSAISATDTNSGDTARKHALLMGASFIRNDSSTDVREHENNDNLTKFLSALPKTAKTLGVNKDTAKQLHGRASIRAQTPDYHPIVGKPANRHAIYTMYGMGSKGFSLAPLCAEVLADMIDGGIFPVSQQVLSALSPERTRLKTPLCIKN